MRKSLCSLALSGILAVAGSAAFAQSDSSAPQSAQSAPSMEGRRGMSPDQQLDRMTKSLQLSSDQQTQIKPILADRQQQMEALHQNQSMSPSDKMAKMKSLRDDSNTKIEAVLNDTQKQQFEQMQTRMREHQRGGGDQ